MNMSAQACKYYRFCDVLILVMSFRGAAATRNLLVPCGIGAGGEKQSLP
jgi:hypothetical protein